jgi:hypothetical protein
MSYHRSIITPNAAEIVAAINIARYATISAALGVMMER